MFDRLHIYIVLYMREDLLENFLDLYMFYTFYMK